MRTAYHVALPVPHNITLAVGDQITFDDRNVLACFRGSSLQACLIISPLSLKALVSAGMIALDETQAS